MSAAPPIRAFEGYGIELEYAIVDAETLDVRPIADRLLRALAGRDASDVTRGELGWSNELVLHVIELKNLAPVSALDALPAAFEHEIQLVNRSLASMSARLMPAGAHPWMNPRAETLLWAPDPADIYATFDRLFNCRSHGWANLQSMHINLPFADDDEFARLHAAIRLVLPLLPALAASSPVVEGKDTGLMDHRLETYRYTQQSIPSIAGEVIPETVASREEYQRVILEPMYREVAPHDPHGVLAHEWLNSRGAIARFDRNAIEIRVCDVQECPLANVAIASVTAAVVESLYSGRLSTLQTQQGVCTDALVHVFDTVLRDAEEAMIDDEQMLGALGMKSRRYKAKDLWRELIAAGTQATVADTPFWREPIAFILEHGSLARRITRAIDGNFERARLHAVYKRLCDCLDDGRMFA